MAQRNTGEVMAGAIVLVVALGFLGYAVANTGRGVVAGYTLHARFDHIDGIVVGSDVRLAGVKVGTVTGTSVDPKTYQAVVSFTIEPSLRLPTDSAALVGSDSLLGGNVLSLSPGGDDKMIPDGGTVGITQSAPSLQDLLGKFIFSVTDLSKNVQKQLDKAAPK
ncbi:MAG: outer membrane lipid asymmetry maintenance protein MlaD [Rhodospirillales bacterium]|nr:outer membrane lipid asymmetry maintenance protein MlaD [Rhodospirillales bacterium]MDE2198124.1 outer membrane lipid asymmetry maintenance protein MlaD [Rhodospirillales bacterium]MDE2575329.1 outer membrane lipid asymmetry maintenance protein MlaD [Rhodospirillales bacterium]